MIRRPFIAPFIARFIVPSAVVLAGALVVAASASSCASGDTIQPTAGAGGVGTTTTGSTISTTSSATGGAGGKTTTSTGSGGSGGATTTSSSTGSGGSGGATGSGAQGGGGAGPTDFLTPCQDDSECQSNVCIQIGDGTKACTIECVGAGAGACPTDDFRCGPLLSAQDPVRYCLPRFNDLCKPCQADQDCWLQHNGTAVFDRGECEKYSSGVGANETVEGSFCTTECTDTTLPCPNGYTCKGVVGSVVKHCFKDDQQCACQTYWQDPSTTCSNTTVDGTCSGTRACASATLSSCSAKSPMAEVCNGLDDNCNGSIDEGGDALCSNGGLGCVTATCGGVAGCSTSINAGFCVIGNAVCVIAGAKNPVDQCLVCDPTKSTTDWTIRTNLACDDGEVCTTGEVCSAAGQCGGGAPTSCAAFGTPPCSMGVCQMGVGCTTVNNDGATCDDGQFCTVNEKCAGGVCGVGVGVGAARDCSAQSVLPCKTGVCNEALDQCVAQINQGTACNDNNPCSTASACNAAGTCAATTLKDCSGQNDDCNVGVCNGTTGLCQQQATNLGGTCDDGDVCTGNGTCSNVGGVGLCTGGTSTGDSFESNNTVGTAKSITAIDDCGNATPTLNATINGSTDNDWFKFTLNNTSSGCDYGTIVNMTPPAGRDYDLQVCVSMSGGFSASCANGSTSFAAPAGLSGNSCCQSTLTGAGVAESVKVNWSCGTFCSDNTGTVHVRVFPKGGSQVAECTNGYTLSWRDD